MGAGLRWGSPSRGWKGGRNLYSFQPEMDKIFLTTAKRRGSDLCSGTGDCDLEVATSVFFPLKGKLDSQWLELIFCSIKFPQIKGGV